MSYPRYTMFVEREVEWIDYWYNQNPLVFKCEIMKLVNYSELARKIFLAPKMFNKNFPEIPF